VSVGRLLAQLGITCQKPLHRAKERDEALVQQWLKKEYPRIKAWREVGADIYLATRRTCVRSSRRPHMGKKGETPIVEATARVTDEFDIGDHFARPHAVHACREGRVNADVFIEF